MANHSFNLSPHGEKRRRELLEAAAKSIAEKPHFRLEEAASRLGFRKSVYHYYFSCKEDVVRAVFREVPRTPALSLSLLAMALEDSVLREELAKELEERKASLGWANTAQSVGEMVLQVLGVSRQERAAE